jgi:hypothetical protein
MGCLFRPIIINTYEIKTVLFSIYYRFDEVVSIKFQERVCLHQHFHANFQKKKKHPVLTTAQKFNEIRIAQTDQADICRQQDTNDYEGQPVTATHAIH